VTSTDTIASPFVKVTRTMTKPAPPPVTKVVTTTKAAPPPVTEVVTKTETEEADPVTVTSVVYQNEANRPSEDPRPDATTVPQTVENQYEHVKKVLGINRDPTSGEVQTVNACESGYGTPDLCSIVHEEWDN
jgi:hypothetical protein